ncbi:ATP-binding protein [Streptomyces sp. SID3343]|uniref:ATP-binding protein n=1 Tax=Streptomyces sp. SID3343 TaxID=2690260 RepID=UPI0013700B87|nr:ATP-binding protein [Streptomyces sp. SID3343]MYW03195.1 hypothetical protein [Streptomyces sp. SID3343]
MNPYDAWPLLTLSALRGQAELIAKRAGLGPERCDDVALVVSELATNGVRHGRGPVLVVLTAVGVELRVSVEDSLLVPIPLQGPPAGTDSDDGRGLSIVRTCADRLSWGVRRGRKFVFAGFDLPSPTVAARVVARLRSPDGVRVIP